MARTQLGLFILGIIVAVVAVLWALTTFGYVQPKNGSSVKSMTSELVKINEHLEKAHREWGPKVERVDSRVSILLDRSSRGGG